jgi:hypothetical protein
VTRVSEEKQAFHGSPKVEASFQCLKETLYTAPILWYPEQGGKFIVNTDASNVGNGRVLLQVQDDQEGVIAY